MQFIWQNFLRGNIVFLHIASSECAVFCEKSHVGVHFCAEISVFQNYCCPVKLKMSCKSSPKPSKHRHRGLFFEKQAPLIKKRRFWWRFRVPFIRDFYPFFFRISHKCNEVDIIHECQTHHGDNLRECAAALDAT